MSLAPKQNKNQCQLDMIREYERYITNGRRWYDESWW